MWQPIGVAARAKNRSIRSIFAVIVSAAVVLCVPSRATSAISSAGDIVPAPPAGGGNVAGPFEIGNVDVGTMNITAGTALTNTGLVSLGNTLTGLGIVTMNGFGSDWVMSSASADMTLGNSGTGSISMTNFAFLSVSDDLFIAVQPDALGEISISGLGTIFIVGDDANIGQRGQAVIEISNGGRLESDQNIIGDEASGDGRVVVEDQFSLWRTTSTMVVADAGRALLQVFDGARVENTTGTVGNLPGSTGTAEVVGLGSLWDNAAGLTIGAAGHGTLLIADGGRVTTGGGINLTTIGRQAGGVGRVEVQGQDSLLSVGAFEVGDLGDGTLRIIGGGRVTSGTVLIGDNANSRGEVVVDGNGSSWEIAGELNIADPADSSVMISNGGRITVTSLVRVTTFGRLTLDGGRLKFDPATPLLNTGVVQGNGVIDGSVTNNAGGLISPWGAAPMVIMRTFTNGGLVDIQSGELEVLGSTNNNSDIDARDGAILRFRANLNNNSGAQLAITSGIVDVFGQVDNNAGAEIAVGGTAVAVFHDAVTNNGTIFVQPGGEMLMLEDLDFSAGASLSLQLREIDLMDPGTDPSDAFGQVQVGSSAALGGTLQVELVGGYMPLAGDAFQILTAGGGRTGMFANEILPTLAGGLNWDVLYNPNSVVLTVVSAGLPGDYNQNGTVDAADYVLWRNNLGSGTSLPNDDTPGVGADDYSRWRANFGRSAGSGAGSMAVPEATATVMLMIASLPFLFRRPNVRT